MAPVKKYSLHNNYCESYSINNKNYENITFSQISSIYQSEWAETDDISILHINQMPYFNAIKTNKHINYY